MGLYVVVSIVDLRHKSKIGVRIFRLYRSFVWHCDRFQEWFSVLHQMHLGWQGEPVCVCMYGERGLLPFTDTGNPQCLLTPFISTLLLYALFSPDIGLPVNLNTRVCVCVCPVRVGPCMCLRGCMYADCDDSKAAQKF